MFQITGTFSNEKHINFIPEHATRMEQNSELVEQRFMCRAVNPHFVNKKYP